MFGDRFGGEFDDVAARHALGKQRGQKREHHRRAKTGPERKLHTECCSCIVVRAGWGGGFNETKNIFHEIMDLCGPIALSDNRLIEPGWLAKVAVTEL